MIEVATKGRVVVFSFGTVQSGIPKQWAASADKPGVNLLKDLSGVRVADIAKRVQDVKQPNDIVVTSIHWGPNWGYEVPRRRVDFAHRLVDEAAVDVGHGHSSHHVKGIEVFKDKLFLYGCGEFLTDYEGIGGYEEFCDDLVVMYFADIDAATGDLNQLNMTPLQIGSFRLNGASEKDTRRLRDVLNREGRRFGTRVELNENGTMTLGWG